MGYFEWQSMTPENILQHLQERKDDMYPANERVRRYINVDSCIENE